jgi:uncharacterized membrane protein YadS
VRKYKDPVTEDELTLQEYISWKIQKVMRNWYFLIAFTIITIIAWSTNNNSVLTWWNLGASYLALVIESIVGIALFNQTKRDAVILREVRANAQRQMVMLGHIEEQFEKIKSLEKKTGVLAEKIEEGKQ